MAELDSYSLLMPLAPWEPPDQVVVALKSVESQTHPPTQVVVSCDGAPPEALASVLAATALPLEVVIGPGLEGVGPVLARGLEVCAFEFVVRADADDISLPTRCELQIRAMSECLSVSSMSSHIAEFIDADMTITGFRKVPVGSKAIAKVACWRNPMNHPAVILRRSHVIEVGNYRAFPGFEDYELWLRLLRYRGPEALSNLDLTLVTARVGFNHLARRHGWKLFLQELQFLFNCGRNGLLTWIQVAILMLLRPVTRLLPVSVFKIIIRTMR
jgi:hypothetical protein